MDAYANSNSNANEGMWRRGSDSAYPELCSAEWGQVGDGQSYIFLMETSPTHEFRRFSRLPMIAPSRYPLDGEALLIEWPAHANVTGERLEWQGVDRFNLPGDRTISKKRLAE
ncbi:MAG: hypothetical protein EPN57_22955 [Paraburkholderia sp.]|nr:MAG: hypothetical protein EPN57_22955 [Paraburkholderia sp.]